jgi:flagellin
MTSQINGLNQAVRNANDAISMIQVAEGALKGMTEMMQRMRELAVQAISDSNTSTDRTALNNEFTQLRDQIEDIADDTTWNGVAFLSTGTDMTFQVGANAGQTITVALENFQNTATSDAPLRVVDSDGDGTVEGTGSGDDKLFSALAITDATEAAASLYGLSAAINKIDSSRANLGASMSRLEYASDNLTNVAQNSSAARSRIMDADYAAETTELARTQIIQQAGTAMLAQANQSQQQVLALLR